jgi:hypothetical protein
MGPACLKAWIVVLYLAAVVVGDQHVPISSDRDLRAALVHSGTSHAYLLEDIIISDEVRYLIEYMRCVP